VDNDLGIGIRVELHTLNRQISAQFEVVFDNAIVNQDNIPGAANVRVSVAGGRFAMGCPAGMPYADGTLQRLCIHQGGKFAQFTGFTPNLNTPRFNHGNARRIITTIFQPAQTVEDNWRGVLPADVANNTTHRYSLAGAANAGQSVSTTPGLKRPRG